MESKDGNCEISSGKFGNEIEFLLKHMFCLLQRSILDFTRNCFYITNSYIKNISFIKPEKLC